jgi:hypothetical protein
MRKYFDEKMFCTLVLAAVTIFFLQHWLTKKVIKDGKMSAYVGNDELGYTKI